MRDKLVFSGQLLTCDIHDICKTDKCQLQKEDSHQIPVGFYDFCTQTNVYTANTVTFRYIAGVVSICVPRKS